MIYSIKINSTEVSQDWLKRIAEWAASAWMGVIEPTDADAVPKQLMRRLRRTRLAQLFASTALNRREHGVTLYSGCFPGITDLCAEV
jgi:hypothetical protein